MPATGDDLRLAIDLYKDANAGIASLWTFFAGVVVPLLIFVLGFTARVPGSVKLALAVIFSCFAALNAYSMWHTQQTLHSAANAIQEMTAAVGVTPALQPTLSTLRAFGPGTEVSLQIALSLVTLAAIAVAHYSPDMLLRPAASP
jgi:hypothetical protein